MEVKSTATFCTHDTFVTTSKQDRYWYQTPHCTVCLSYLFSEKPQSLEVSCFVNFILLHLHYHLPKHTAYAFIFLHRSLSLVFWIISSDVIPLTIVTSFRRHHLLHFSLSTSVSFTSDLSCRDNALQRLSSYCIIKWTRLSLSYCSVQSYTFIRLFQATVASYFCCLLSYNAYLPPLWLLMITILMNFFLMLSHHLK